MQKKILVIQTAFLGDIVLATGLLRTLRLRNPEARIVFLTTPVGSELVAKNSWDLELITFDKRGKDSGWAGFRRILAQVRGIGFDEVFSLHRYPRSTLLAFLSGAKRIYGFREALGSFFFTHRVSRADHSFESERNLALLGQHSRDDLIPELFTTKEDEENGDQLLAELDGQPFLALAPSSAWATKRWPVERFAELAHWAWVEKGIRSVILAGPSTEEVNLAGMLVHHFVHISGRLKQLEGIPLNLGGRTSLGSMKRVLARAKAVVANDSAPLHIATAMGKPVVGIYGPTSKDLGFFPLGREGSTEVAEVDLYCRPCGKHGHNVCPEAHFRCMRELSSRIVKGKLERFL